MGEDLPMASAVGFVDQRGVPALLFPRVSCYCRWHVRHLIKMVGASALAMLGKAYVGLLNCGVARRPRWRCAEAIRFREG